MLDGLARLTHSHQQSPSVAVETRKIQPVDPRIVAPPLAERDAPIRGQGRFLRIDRLAQVRQGLRQAITALAVAIELRQGLVRA